MSIDNWPSQCNTCGNNYYAPIRYDSGYCSDKCEEREEIEAALHQVAVTRARYLSATGDAEEALKRFREAVRDARVLGATYPEIGRRAGVTRQRVHQMVRR